YALPGLVPVVALMQRGVQHPLAERADQARLFGEWDEARRREQAVLRMLPAGERLDSIELSGSEIHEGLVMEDDLVELERRSQLTDEGEAIGRVGILIRFVERITRMRALRDIHCDVRTAEQRVGVRAVVR